MSSEWPKNWIEGKPTGTDYYLVKTQGAGNRNIFIARFENGKLDPYQSEGGFTENHIKGYCNLPPI